jgi:hypothetical protein
LPSKEKSGNTFPATSVKGARMAKQKLEQTNFRTTPDLKRRLEAAADAGGRSFNKEVNKRLAESFDPSRQLDPVLLNDPILFAMMIVVAKAMKRTGDFALLLKDEAKTKNEHDWHADAYVYALAVDAAIEVFNLLRPADDTIAGPQFEPDQSKLGEAVAEAGKLFGRGEVRHVTSRDVISSPLLDALRDMFGEQMIERIQGNLERLK